MPLGYSTGTTKFTKKQFLKNDMKSISVVYDRLDKTNS